MASYPRREGHPDSVSDQPTAARAAYLYTAGLAFLALAKAKHWLSGYSSPKPFELSQTDRAIRYDLQVVDEWRQHLARCFPGADLAGRHVLELGPGSDLGIGLYLRALGAASYGACDVHNLVSHAPAAFYEALIARIAQTVPGSDPAALAAELDAAQRGASPTLRYVVRDDFDLAAAFGENRFDLVFSQAAFEHFDDVEATVARLTRVCRPGALVTAVIDLKTHSRWIKDRDPNNIYRYPRALYDAFHFRGQPNRWRPYQYAQAFERHGWRDLQVFPIESTALPYQAQRISRAYDAPVNQLEYLTIVLCARNGRMH